MTGVLFALGVIGSAVLWSIASWRTRLLAPVEPEEELRTAGDLETGVFRMRGRVVPVEVSRSPVDGAPCVFIEHADYEPVAREALPLRRQVDHRIIAHAFYVEDATGVVYVEPADAEIDTAVLVEDGGLTAERRLRSDEEVELVGTFELRTVELDGGPYRSAGQTWVAHSTTQRPLRISYRTDPGMVTPSDSLTLFFRGAATLTLGIFTFLGVFSALVGH